MKKIVYLFLVCILVVTLRACGAKEEENTNKVDNTTTETVKEEKIEAFNPLKGEMVVTKAFSAEHQEVDLQAKKGTKVYSVFEGTVKSTGKDKQNGSYVVVEYKDGTTVEYRHLSKISVKSGATIKAKALIGKSGSTGTVTGPVLTIAVKDKSGNYIDPLSLEMQNW